MESGGKDLSRPPISAEEQALKKNTDCVYFLASPLTCKKGSECDYRHSDGARANPTDCWFWLNGNCLNPKCAFRHPPLEGFPDAQTSTTSGPTQPTDSKKSTKQTVPCYYFQNGWCLKGSRCSFMHGSQPPTFPAKSTLPSVAPSQQNKPEQVTDKGIDFFGPSTKVPWITAKTPTPISPLANQQSDLLSHPIDQSNEPDSWQLQPIDQHIENGREGDDLRESSPGFDVLVEEHEDAGYFQDDEGLDMVNSVDFHDEVDFYDEVDFEFERYGQRSQYHEERPLDVSDLRCKLSMQRKTDRPRSAIVAHPHYDHHGDYHDGDHDHGSRRSQSQSQSQGVLAGRLQGRVKFPGSSHVDKYRSGRFEREGERRRKGRSSSPGRRWGRHKQKVNEIDSRREEEEAGPLSFVGPKTLAELKGRKREEAIPLFERPKLMSAVLKRKREETEEGSGLEEREGPRDHQNLQNGDLELDDDDDDGDDDDDDFSRKVGSMFS